MSFNILDRIAKADELKSVDAIKKSVEAGTIPGFIGWGMINQLVENAEEAKALAQGAPNSTVVDQINQKAQALKQLQQPMPYQMAASDRPPIPQQIPPQNPMPIREQVAGIDAAQSNLPTQNMAGGGIVAFAGENGSLVDDEYDPYDDEDNEEYYADMEHQSKLAQLIAESEAESDALTQDMLENPEAYAGNAGTGIKYKEPIPAGGTKGLMQKMDFANKIRHLESRGRDYDQYGNVLTSSKGAMGSMQTMPNTLRDPGFGVKPAQDNSVAEMNRVGIDYANAMLRRYGNEKDAAMAYNWGPGNVDKWIAGGRQGAVPGETRQYASNFAEGGIVGLAAGGSVPRFYDGVYITDPEGITRRPNYPLTNPNAPTPSATSRAVVPYQAPTSQGLAEAPPTFYQKYIQPNISKVIRGTGAAIGEAPMTTLGVPAVGGILSYGAANALSNATDEQLEQLQGDVGSDTSLAAAIIAQGRKAEAKKPEAKKEEPSRADYDNLTKMAVNDATKINKEVVKEESKGTSPSDAQAKAEQTLFEQMQEAIKKRSAALEDEKSIDNYLAVLQGFLGMMGGTSPYAMVNIGQGASSGISTLLAARKQTGLAERALGRDQMGLLTAQNAINRQAQDRALRERALRNQEAKLSVEERIKSANAYETARKDMMKEFGFNLIQYNNLKQKAMTGKLDEKEKANFDALQAMYDDIDRRAKNQVYGGGTMPGFRIVGMR